MKSIPNPMSPCGHLGHASIVSTSPNFPSQYLKPRAPGAWRVLPPPACLQRHRAHPRRLPTPSPRHTLVVTNISDHQLNPHGMFSFSRINLLARFKTVASRLRPPSLSRVRLWCVDDIRIDASSSPKPTRSPTAKAYSLYNHEKATSLGPDPLNESICCAWPQI
jgi:hypothetical protein